MTGAPVKDVGSLLNFTGSRKAGTFVKSAGIGDFENAMSRASYSGKDSFSGDAVSGGAVKTEENNGFQKEKVNQSHPRKDALKKEVKNSEAKTEETGLGPKEQQEITDAGNEIVSEVAKALAISEEEVQKAMEELGIGRPSTYAPTITTILARHYIVKEKRNLYVTELGEVVNNMMKDAFPTIVDVNFTANLETLLDGVAEGSVKWKTIVENFYPDLNEAVTKAEKELAQVQIAEEESDEVCETCGRRMVIKYGPHGKFLACPGFPECKNTKPYFEKIGVACPKCGKDVVIKKTKKGRKYYGCIDNPECDFMVWQKPSNINCKECGSVMLEKGNKLVCSNENCGFVTDKG